MSEHRVYGTMNKYLYKKKLDILVGRQTFDKIIPSKSCGFNQKLIKPWVTMVDYIDQNLIKMVHVQYSQIIKNMAIIETIRIIFLI